MSEALAIEIKGDSAHVVSGELLPDGFVSVSKVLNIPLGAALHAPAEETTGGEPTEEAAASQPTKGILHSYFEELRDAALGVINENKILYQTVTLPFKDQKQIDQVAPLQLQDSIPFDIDDFLIDNLIVSQSAKGGSDVITTIIPESEIQNTLEKFSSLGIEPKVISTKSSCIAGLRYLFQEELKGSFFLATKEETGICIALFVNDELKSLAFLPTSSQDIESQKEKASLLSQFSCLKSKADEDYGQEISSLYIAGRFSALSDLLQKEIEVHELDLSKVTKYEDGSLTNANLSWAIGLLAFEGTRKKEKPLINLRRGKFAYRPVLGDVINAFKEEAGNFIILAAVILLFYASSLYLNYTKLDSINELITSKITEQIPSASLSTGGEAALLDKEITDIEDKLSKVGSLSSLSPLEIIKELSTVFDRSIDISVDQIGISQGRVNVRGSVPDLTTVGKLDGLIQEKSQKFCRVKVDPKGKETGTGRLNFIAELEVCD